MGFRASPAFRRELLEMARRSTTHVVRALAVVVMSVVVWNAVEPLRLGAATSGRPLFIGLNRLVFAFLWIVGPLLTADCLSREKREGTIGLLFLTPLRPIEVVLSKVAAHCLQGASVLLAIVPVLVVPLLLGGITLPDVVRMALLQAAALALALTSGLLASSLFRDGLVARLAAVGFSAAAAAGVVFLHVTASTLGQHLATPSNLLVRSFEDSWFLRWRMLWWTSGLRYGSVNFLSAPQFNAGTGWIDVAAAAGVLALSLAAVLGAVHLAGRSLVRTWRPAEQPNRGSRLVGSARNPSHRIPADPAAWLVRRLDGRLHDPGLWLLLGLGVGILLAGTFSRRPNEQRDLLLVALSAGSALHSWRRIFQTEADELLRTTPLPQEDLIGRWQFRIRLAAVMGAVGGAAGSQLMGWLRTGRLPVPAEALPWLAGLQLWMLAMPPMTLLLHRVGLPAAVSIGGPLLCRELWERGWRGFDPEGAAATWLARIAVGILLTLLLERAVRRPVHG
jgi:ABC-type transport system involved in multi-copper enzyme maturation permease subunit